MPVQGRAARTKGSRYELELAADAAAAGLPVLRRTPNSGGLHIKGDLKGWEGWSIEAKRQERLAIWACLDQAQRQASPGEVPLLVFRRNQGSSFACLPWREFLGVLVELQGARND